MAEVFLAMDGTRPVALKRILPHLTAQPRFIEVFRREAQLSIGLRHPNLVRVLDSGAVDNVAFVVLELVNGRTLREVMLRGPLDPALIAFIAREVLRGLQHAHAAVAPDGSPLRLIHRDVSPSNILIGFDGSVKLGDFGLLKALADASTVTSSHAGLGTLKYAAPEQIEGRAIDARADLFSVGAILRDALTGVRMPTELEAVCRRASSEDPASRYESADEMAVPLDKLARELGGDAVRLAATLCERFPDVEPVDWTVEATMTRAEGGGRAKWAVAAVLVIAIGALWVRRIQPSADASIETASRVTLSPPPDASRQTSPHTLVALPTTEDVPPLPLRASAPRLRAIRRVTKGAAPLRTAAPQAIPDAVDREIPSPFSR
jgi:serine/threonine protein kinase